MSYDNKYTLPRSRGIPFHALSIRIYDRSRHSPLEMSNSSWCSNTEHRAAEDAVSQEVQERSLAVLGCHCVGVVVKELGLRKADRTGDRLAWRHGTGFQWRSAGLKVSRLPRTELNTIEKKMFQQRFGMIHWTVTNL
jgi:hypothetical protein